MNGRYLLIDGHGAKNIVISSWFLLVCCAHRSHCNAL